MWELYTIINGKTGEKQEFSDFKEGKKAFRKAVKQAFDENPKLLEHFIAQIDAYCDKYFPAKKRAKKPVPSSFNSLKNVLTNYATNAAYNINPDVFFITNYQDKNIEICWADLYNCDGTITLYTKIIKKEKKKPVIFPKLYIPLRFKDDEFGNYFAITDNPDGQKSLLPNTFSISVRLDPADNGEYFDEDDYDEDDDDYEGEDYDDDCDDEEEYSPPARSPDYSYSRSSAQVNNNRLTLAEKREIDRAQHKYNYAVRMAADKPGSEIRANEEKRAHAEYMRVLAKYAGKK